MLCFIRPNQISGNKVSKRRLMTHPTANAGPFIRAGFLSTVLLASDEDRAESPVERQSR
jgi:hypothetical protein